MLHLWYSAKGMSRDTATLRPGQPYSSTLTPRCSKASGRPPELFMSIIIFIISSIVIIIIIYQDGTL